MANERKKIFRCRKSHLVLGATSVVLGLLGVACAITPGFVESSGKKLLAIVSGSSFIMLGAYLIATYFKLQVIIDGSKLVVCNVFMTRSLNFSSVTHVEYRCNFDRQSRQMEFFLRTEEQNARIDLLAFEAGDRASLLDILRDAVPVTATKSVNGQEWPADTFTDSSNGI